MKANISSIVVEPGQAGQRFVIGLKVGENYEYFSSPLNPTTEQAKTSVRINIGQLRNALPSLMGKADPVREMLLNRSKFIGVEVDIEVEDQKKDGVVVINERTGKAYHNVRLMPASADLTEEQVNALLAGVPTQVPQDLES